MQSSISQPIDYQFNPIYTSSFAEEWKLIRKWSCKVDEHNTDFADGSAMKITWEKGWAGLDIGLKSGQKPSNFGAAEYTHIRLHIHTKGNLLNLGIEPRLKKEDKVRRQVGLVIKSDEFQSIEIPL